MNPNLLLDWLYPGSFLILSAGAVGWAHLAARGRRARLAKLEGEPGVVEIRREADERVGDGSHQTSAPPDAVEIHVESLDDLDNRARLLLRDRRKAVYVKARPKARAEGSSLTDYVVEEENSRVLHTTRTQEQAIKWAKDNGHTPHVARAQHEKGRNKPDHWHKV